MLPPGRIDDQHDLSRKHLWAAQPMDAVLAEAYGPAAGPTLSCSAQGS